VCHTRLTRAGLVWWAARLVFVQGLDLLLGGAGGLVALLLGPSHINLATGQQLAYYPCDAHPL